MALPPPHPSRTCLVTGASSGIGAELARALARRQYGLTLVARREDRLRALADELVTDSDIRVEVVAADLAETDQRTELAETIEQRGLTVDVLVNNAGVSTFGPVAGARRAAELTMVRTNVESVVDLCTLFVPGMAERRCGAVLNVASTAAFQPLPGQAAYGAAKAFVLSFSQAVRAELRGTGVSLTALCPGPVKTEFAETAGFTPEEAEASLPGFMWLPAARVARQAIEGLALGKAVVIPGFANRVGAQLGRNAPRAVLTSFLARQHPALR
jgi:uncharacterized protein